MAEILVKQKYKLRSFSQDDILPIITNINSKIIERDTTLQLPWTAVTTSWWVDFINSAELQTPMSEFHRVIEVNGKIAGAVGVINIRDHKGEIGYWMADKYSGQGIMSQVISEFVNVVFKELKLVRIFAPVLPHNKASCRVLEKNGFEFEGVLRKFYEKDGKFVDALGYSLVV